MTFLVFVVEPFKVEVKLVFSAKDLLTFPEDTKVMAQWRGQYRSDFFQFTVAQFRNYIAEQPKETYHQV
ncbi:MAG TPA: hypothetical protein VGK04_11705 [Thermoanaerobaculia bacterium]